MNASAPLRNDRDLLQLPVGASRLAASLTLTPTSASTSSLTLVASVYMQDGFGTSQWEEEEGKMMLNWSVLLLLAFVLAGVTGNVLVCVAIAAEKRLQNITNYFLMSLALADLLVSVVVMPCAIVNELMGE